MQVYSEWNGQVQEVEGACPPGFTELAPPVGMPAPMFRGGAWVSAMPWSPPYVPTAEDLAAQAVGTRAELTKENNAKYEAAIGKMTSEYPDAEITTWERQRTEAVAWGADNSAPTPWIDIAAYARGLPRVEYLTRTLAKVIAFAGASAYLTGVRQGIDDQIRAAVTPADLAAITIDYTLPEA